MEAVSLVELIVFVAVVGTALVLFNLLVAASAQWKQAVNIIGGVLLFIVVLIWAVGFLGGGNTLTD